MSDFRDNSDHKESSGRAEPWPAAREPLDEQEQHELRGNSTAEINSDVFW